jgi:carbon monoxide dehydrogenase subunit G
MKTEGTITIRKTPKEIFPYLNDAEKIQQWTGVKNMRLLTDGPVGIGSKFAQTIAFLGQSFESVTEVTAYDEPQSLAIKSTSGPMPFEQRMTLSPTEEGTKLEIVAEGEPGGFFKLAQPLLAPALHKQLQDQLGKLKRLAEQ